MITGKRFYMENPLEVRPGHVLINLTISQEYIAFVQALPFVADVEDFTSVARDFYRVWLDPRFNIEDAWLELYELLDTETQKVQLDDVWGLDDIFPDSSDRD